MCQIKLRDGRRTGSASIKLSLEKMRRSGEAWRGTVRWSYLRIDWYNPRSDFLTDSALRVVIISVLFMLVCINFLIFFCITSVYGHNPDDML